MQSYMKLLPEILSGDTVTQPYMKSLFTSYSVCQVSFVSLLRVWQCIKTRAKAYPLVDHFLYSHHLSA